MKNKFLLLFFFWSFVVFGQETGRKLMKGLVVSDSIQVENITIRNSTANIFTVTDANGNFKLLAKENDTLVFSGVSFLSSYLVVSQTHVSEAFVKIRLSVKINELDELVVRPYTLSGNLETDTKKLVVKTVNLNLEAVDLSLPKFDYTSVTNSALKSITPGTGNDYNGVDLKMLGKRIAKAIFKSKPKPKKVEFVSDKIFSEAVREKFSGQFFLETLKLKPEQVVLFLAFCDDNSAHTRALLHPGKEFELIDYLLKKSEEYLKKNQ